MAATRSCPAPAAPTAASARGLVAAAVGLIAVLLLALGVLATPARAIPTGAEGSNPALIDGSRTAVLRIDKSLVDPFTEYGDPQRGGQVPPKAAAAGAVFEARRIEGVDLTTQAGWVKAEGLNVAEFAAGTPGAANLGEAHEATTGGDGVAVFNDLPLGLYYVTEQAGSATAKNWSVAEPFIIALPSTDPEARDSWRYDVSVHAKDQKLTATKDAGVKCATEGETVEYGITATVPEPYRDGTMSSVAIYDPIDPASTYVVGSENVYITNAANGAEERLVKLEDSDYTAGVEDTNGETIAHVELTDSGRAKLAEKRKGNPLIALTWTFQIHVDHIPASGQLLNRGYLIVDGYPPFTVPTRPGVPTNETKIKVQKHCGSTETETSETETKETETSDTPTSEPTPDSPTSEPTPETTPKETTPAKPTPAKPTPAKPKPNPNVPHVPVPVPGPGIPVPPADETTPEPAPATPEGPRDLAQTGADSWRTILAGALLLGAGAMLLRRRRNEDH